MSHAYQAVGWNRQKKIYDFIITLGILVYLGVFLVLGAILFPKATAETLMIRAFGTAAFLMLHIILSIGPLCRLNRKYLPLLYNRRHCGVSMFLLALIHGVLSIIQFHGFGNLNPIVSLLTNSSNYSEFSQWPFQPLGFFALIILFFMAATSHDFWLANLTAPVWKALHTMVYIAYGLLVLHVVLGVLQSETSPVYLGIIGVGLGWILVIHWIAGGKEAILDQTSINTQEDDEFIEICSVEEIQEKQAKIVTLSGERVAIFKYDGKISALSNVCQHQNGPLGEGRIIDGCITCPWHGYQYLPETGASPPPFTEKVPTFRVRIQAGNVWLNPQPLPPGSRVEPALIES